VEQQLQDFTYLQRNRHISLPRIPAIHQNHNKFKASSKGQRLLMLEFIQYESLCGIKKSTYPCIKNRSILNVFIFVFSEIYPIMKGEDNEKP
jgi:hypothetical protein